MTNFPLLEDSKDPVQQHQANGALGYIVGQALDDVSGGLFSVSRWIPISILKVWVVARLTSPNARRFRSCWGV